MIPRSLYQSQPPPARTAIEDNPTLLVSWWCTGFALTTILLRMGGRYVRTEKLFREDKVMALAIIPLLIRMALVHVVLRFGTNNVDTTGLSAEDIHKREIGSRLVLPARLMYAAFLWTAKFTITEFLRRLTESQWRRTYELVLQSIRYLLIISFIAVFISTLGECHPFTHYWQVVPDPGPKCRQGYAQLITMGAADIITDLLLVLFPIPIVIASAMPLKRKVSLVLLFALSLFLVACTCYRVPSIIERKGRQQFRTLWASLEILASAGVSNALVIGSFVRDRGIKKAKYKFGSTSESMDRPSTRRGTMTAQYWGSDEDLVRDLGIRLDPDLRDLEAAPRPAPMALPLASQAKAVTPAVGQSWRFPSGSETDSDDLKIPHLEPSRSPGDVSSINNSKKVSFFDVGGLLENEDSRDSTSSAQTLTANTSLPATQAHDFASPRNQGSRAILHDIGGLLSTHEPRRDRSHSSSRGRSNSRRSHRRGSHDEHRPPLPIDGPNGEPPSGVPNITLARTDTIQSLQDVGGLLNPEQRQQLEQRQQEHQQRQQEHHHLHHHHHHHSHHHQHH